MTVQSQTKPRFVFFDLDGTLYDVVAATDAALVTALERGCDLLGLDKQAIADYRQKFWQEYFRLVEQTQITDVYKRQILPWPGKAFPVTRPRNGPGRWRWCPRRQCWLSILMLRKQFSWDGSRI